MNDVPVRRFFFDATREVLPNPFIGIMSFNHFRGGKLYSDTSSSEGWIKERYPVAENIPQEGTAQGWHPESEMAYLRILWKDFEPEEGKFNYELVEEILEQVRAHRQFLMLRLMPHTTRPDEDVPDWLRAQIPCPERPAHLRVKESPTDPLYFVKFARAVRALGERFDRDPVFYATDISLYGAWGEGHRYDSVPTESLKLILDAYTDAYPNTWLLGQIIAPELAAYCRETRPVGWRADGFGDPYHMHRYFPTRINPIMTDYWKTAPVSGEAYWYMNEWKRQGWDIRELSSQIIKWHVSTFNNKSSAIPLEWYGEIQDLLIHMGYRFALRTLETPDTARPGETVSLYLWFENRGNAPIYTRIPVVLKLRGEADEREFSTGIDITRWLPGDCNETLQLTLPEDLRPGEYEWELRIGGRYPEAPLIRLATAAETDGDWYRIGTITVAEP